MNLTTNNGQWKGYTLEELRYRQAIVKARTEIEKYRLGVFVEQVKEHNALFGSKSVFSRVAGAFSYAEYAILAYRIARKVLPVLRKKK